MKQSALFKVATQSIIKNKMRALLTMLGIVIGVGAVIVMVSVGNGAQKQIASQITSLLGWGFPFRLYLFLQEEDWV